MTKAKLIFEYSIKDAEELLAHFDSINKKPPPENAEVLKRAGLIMALTAWETFIEDLIVEEIEKKISILKGSIAGDFISDRLNEELKRFHNPNSEKTRKIFKEYLKIDIYEAWEWPNFDKKKTRDNLDALMSKRGDAVHRSKVVTQGTNAPHLVKREELEKAISFLKTLVEKTDSYISSYQSKDA